MSNYIMTNSGVKFNVFSYGLDDINIFDIAHALSNMCRFAGHVKNFYSVAQHSILVSMFASDPRYGLLHDASEAYLLDIPSPIKRSQAFSEYRDIERKLQRSIYERFGLSADSEPSDVHVADQRVCATEIQQLLHHSFDFQYEPYLTEIIAMSPKEAERAFIERFITLFPEHSKTRAVERVSWDATWMTMARQIAQRSYDPRLKVGAVIVNDENTMILSHGYNGNYRGGPNETESSEPGKSGMIHAELNAIIKLDYHSLQQKYLYVTHSPCEMCAKAIINARISKVVYESDYRDFSGITLLKKAGVLVHKFVL